MMSLAGRKSIIRSVTSYVRYVSSIWRAFRDCHSGRRAVKGTDTPERA